LNSAAFFCVEPAYSQNLYMYPVSISWTKWPDCLREGFSSSLTERINDEYEE
jgi:hypothetical protein